jgi:hypothetical protein
VYTWSPVAPEDLPSGEKSYFKFFSRARFFLAKFSLLKRKKKNKLEKAQM